MSKRELLKEISQRMARCEARGDLCGRDDYALIWHRINRESDDDATNLQAGSMRMREMFPVHGGGYR